MPLRMGFIAIVTLISTAFGGVQSQSPIEYVLEHGARSTPTHQHYILVEIDHDKGTKTPLYNFEYDGEKADSFYTRAHSSGKHQYPIVAIRTKDGALFTANQNNSQAVAVSIANTFIFEGLDGASVSAYKGAHEFTIRAPDKSYESVNLITRDAFAASVVEGSQSIAVLVGDHAARPRYELLIFDLLPPAGLRPGWKIQKSPALTNTFDAPSIVQGSKAPVVTSLFSSSATGHVTVFTVDTGKGFEHFVYLTTSNGTRTIQLPAIPDPAGGNFDMPERVRALDLVKDTTGTHVWLRAGNHLVELSIGQTNYYNTVLPDAFGNAHVERSGLAVGKGFPEGFRYASVKSLDKEGQRKFVDRFSSSRPSAKSAPAPAASEPVKQAAAPQPPKGPSDRAIMAGTKEFQRLNRILAYLGYDKKVLRLEGNDAVSLDALEEWARALENQSHSEFWEKSIFARADEALTENGSVAREYLKKHGLYIDELGRLRVAAWARGTAISQETFAEALGWMVPSAVACSLELTSK